jgi:hypothetical protein
MTLLFYQQAQRSFDFSNVTPLLPRLNPSVSPSIQQLKNEAVPSTARMISKNEISSLLALSKYPPFALEAESINPNFTSLVSIFDRYVGETPCLSYP